MPPRTVAVGLTPERIVATALALMDEHGVDWMTMRRLAAELGVSAPTLYWHVDNRSDLIDLAIALALEGGEAPLPAEGPWQDRMAAFMRDLRHRLTAHPSVTDMVRHRYPPAVHQLTVRAVEVVAGLGMAPEETATRTRLMIWQVLGFATLENNIRLGTAYHERMGTGATYAVSAPGAAPDQERSEVEQHLGVLDLDELFELDLRVFVAGLEALTPAPRPVRRARRA